MPIDPAADLAATRQQVADGLPAVPPAIRPPAALAVAPLRMLAPEIEAKLAARIAAGRAPLGTDHPRDGVWQRVVVPSLGLAVLDAVGLLIAALTGHSGLAIGAVVLLVVFLGIAVGVGVWATHDPLWLSVRERRAVSDASHWESKHVWTGALGESRERALLVIATKAAEQIVGNPAWYGPGVAEHRIQLDLIAELDQIDEQAYRLASAGPGTGDEAWDALLTRVAALAGYAGALDLITERVAGPAALDEPLTPELLAGAARDELAADELARLTYLLRATVQ